MATDTKSDAATEAEVHDAVESDHGSHPTPKTYWKIFWILFAITAIEVGLYYKSFSPVNLNNIVLGLFAGVKFVVVVGFFMHLRFDNRLLRRLFVTGLILATIVYVIYMLTLGVFIDHPDVHHET